MIQTIRIKKCLCIIDSGKVKWAGFVNLPIKSDLSYANKIDGFKLTVIAYDAMVEWKKYAERLIPAYYFQDNTSFWDYLKNQLMNRFFMYFQNDIPTNIGVQPIILNKSLFVWSRAGGNDNFTIYNIIRALAVWGLVYKFDVPSNYESLAWGGDRVPLTFRLMRRVNGKPAVMKPQDYYRTQLPKIDKNWVLLVNHRYNLSDTYFTNERTYDIVHGVLMNESITYNFDNYNFMPPAQGGPPNPCFILDSSEAAYQKILTVFQDGGIVKQIELEDVLIVEKDMFKLNLTSSAGQEYSLKFMNSRIYKDWSVTNRSNSRIAPHRIFCNQYIPEPNDYGIYDNCINLNSVLPAKELKVLLKNRGSVQGTTGILTSEPDLFDTFTVPYKGVNEVHSIISLDLDYNFSDGGDAGNSSSGKKAEYQTVRIA
ncbi:MAG: hypothetical protein UZ05_CHB002000256 [Chlorobi bacterium OLB5]|nr:MAG: hypothetical protein UZ05_CHB002000256 [Chlorobi bacterium OLB5]